jgi:hypothetical protein
VSVTRLQLHQKHTWKSRPGYAICVLDRGAARFDFPAHWIVEHKDGSVMLHDRKPSVESCDVGVSLFPIPAAVVNGLSLDELLVNCARDAEQECEQSDIVHEDRNDLQIAWIERRHIDKDYQRAAKFRVAIVRGPRAHLLITMNYWADRAAGLEKVWKEVLRTLVLDVKVADPLRGPVMH